MKAAEAKKMMVDEIECMTDTARLENEYNHFFGTEETIEDDD